VYIGVGTLVVILIILLIIYKPRVTSRDGHTHGSVGVAVSSVRDGAMARVGCTDGDHGQCRGTKPGGDDGRSRLPVPLRPGRCPPIAGRLAAGRVP
jgi:hypothetical protein